LKAKTKIPVYYYISPKIWAWKEWRIKAIKRDVKEMFSILPFEVPFYEEKHKYKIHYVGNPTAQEIAEFRSDYHEGYEDFCNRNNLDSSRPIIALLAGSRKQEIKDNLPAMIEAASHFEDYQIVLAGAPSIEDKFYQKYIDGTCVKKVSSDTYPLLAHSQAALVTSGTATLETALFDVPQVVCYETPLPKFIRFAFKHIIKVEFISLVNLIAGKEVVPEMLADRFTVDGLVDELYKILPGQKYREQMLEGYQGIRIKLGNTIAPDNAARIMVDLLSQK
jgi:lipid-A-disaccharide synthase